MGATEVAAAAVKTAAGSSINAGIWTLVGLVVLTLGGIVTATIKQWGPWKKGEADADTQLRAEMWKDIASLKLSKAEQNVRLTAAEIEIATARVEIGQQRFILNLVITELEIVSPGNAIARQARILMDQVQPAAFHAAAAPFAQDLTDKLNGTGVGE